MPNIDFSGTSAYRDSTRGATIKALQLRQQKLQEETAAAQAPRQIASPWQGAAQIAGVVGSSIREARAANDEQAGRQRFAELLAGGLTPDEMGEAIGLDPETAMKYQEHAWRAGDAQTAIDEQRKSDLIKNGWDVDAAAARVQAEKDQAAERARVEALRQDDQQQAASDLSAQGAKQASTQAVQNAALGPEIAKINEAVKAGTLTPEAGQQQIDLINKKAQADIAALEPETYRPPTAQEIKDYNIDPKKAVRINTKTGKPEEISGAGTNITIGSEDKKQISDTDEAIMGGQYTISTLKGVLQGTPENPSLNDRAYSGPFAEEGASTARLPVIGGLFDKDRAAATTELKTVVLDTALTQLKTIFGGMPTEGERKVLLDMQGSIEKTPQERKIIFERAIKKAEVRLRINQAKSKALREGTYYTEPLPQDIDAMDTGEVTTPPSASSGGAPVSAPASTTGGLPEPKSAAERDALAPGTQYKAPDGSTRIR
jgi:hypothetical protein